MTAEEPENYIPQAITAEEAEGIQPGIRYPYMLELYIKANRKDDPMPLYGINIEREEDMFARRRREEEWNRISVGYSSSMDCDAGTSSVDSGSDC